MEEERGACCPEPCISLIHHPCRAGLHQRYLSFLSVFAQLGLKHSLVAHTFRTNIIPLHPPPVFLVCRISLQPVPRIPEDAGATLRNVAWKPIHPQASHRDTGNEDWKVPSARLWILREVSVCGEEQRGVTGPAFCSSLRSCRRFLNGVLVLRQTRFAFTKNRGVGFLFVLYQSM